MATITANAGAAGTWDASTTTTWVGGVAPTAADDVVVPAGTTSITIATGAVCRSVDFNGCAGTVTQSGDLNVGDSGAPAGAIAFRGSSTAGFTWSPSGTRTITFKSTNATSQTIYMGNKMNFQAVTINGSGSNYVAGDSWTLSSSLTRAAGNIDFTTNTTTVTFTSVTGSTPSFSTMTGANKFHALTLSPATPSQTRGATLGGDIEIANNFTVSSGTNPINRYLISSTVIGTQRTITCNGTVSVDNADFKDIIGTTTSGTGTTWDMSGATHYTGNCGGNRMYKDVAGTVTEITPTSSAFTAATNQTCSTNTSFTWSTASWTSHIPLPQDTALITGAFASTMKTITMDQPRVGAMDFSGATGSSFLTLTVSTGISIFGSVTLLSGMTNTANGNVWTFEGRNAMTLTTNGVTLNVITVNCNGSSLTLGSNLTTNATRLFTLTAPSTFDTSSYSMSVGQFTAGGNSTLTLGATTHYLTGTGTIFTLSSTGTVSVTGSTIQVTDTSNTSVTVNLASKTIGSLWFNRGASTGAITIASAGACGVNEIKDTGTVAHTITFPNVTMTLSTWSISGNSGQLITLARTGVSGTFTVSKSSGTVSADYLSISNSTATGGASWYAGANSTNGGGNTGWTFSAPPAGGNSTNFFLFA